MKKIKVDTYHGAPCVFNKEMINAIYHSLRKKYSREDINKMFSHSQIENSASVKRKMLQWFNMFNNLKVEQLNQEYNVSFIRNEIYTKEYLKNLYSQKYPKLKFN